MVGAKDDSKVQEWMRNHPEKVEQVQTKYDELKELGVDNLLIMAVEKGVDVSKFAGLLITAILAAESKK